MASDVANCMKTVTASVVEAPKPSTAVMTEITRTAPETPPSQVHQGTSP